MSRTKWADYTTDELITAVGEGVPNALAAAKRRLAGLRIPDQVFLGERLKAAKARAVAARKSLN